MIGAGYLRAGNSAFWIEKLPRSSKVSLCRIVFFAPFYAAYDGPFFLPDNLLVFEKRPETFQFSFGFIIVHFELTHIKRDRVFIALPWGKTGHSLKVLTRKKETSFLNKGEILRGCPRKNR